MIALLAVAAHAVPPEAGGFSFATAPGRLPKDVVPERYRVHLDVGAGPAFSGHEEVELRFDAPADRVVFHTNLMRLSDVRFDGAEVASVTTDAEAQLTTVALSAPAAVGRHTLSVAWRGRMNDEPSGIFRLRYTDVYGERKVIVSTQLEATDARRVFPCWDEPAFRAVFEVSATVPAEWAAIGNMPVVSRAEEDGRATVQFAPSPSMSTYLVELTAGELAAVRGRAGDVDVAVWAQRGREEEGRTALADAVQTLGDMDAWFGIPYPLPKLDLIGLPGGWDGAMENWGAITYSERYLLVGPETTLGARQTACDTSTHEIAHQWFGNLVTMGWWDDLWLNESFASWMGTRQTATRQAAWSFYETMDVAREGALWADARAGARPVRAGVLDERSALAGFDPEITYAKGQAVLRMLESYVGEETFRAGVQRYLSERAYSNATAADLWGAIGEVAGADARALAETWTRQPGFPLVRARSTCEGGRRVLALTQSRFLLDPAPSDAAWRVPLTVRVGREPVRTVVLGPEGATIEAGGCADPVSLNAGAIGYYRVAYDDAALGANTAAFASLPELDRVALLDDVWALVLVGERPLADYLALVEALPVTAGERAWTQALEALHAVERAERGRGGHDAFVARAVALLRPLDARLGPTSDPATEPPQRIALRSTVRETLGRWGDPAVRADARARYAAWKADRSAMTPDDRGWVLPVIASDADAAQFEELRAISRASRAPDERRAVLAAMMAVRDPALARLAARIAVSREVPPELVSARLELLMELADAHAPLAWDTLTDHLDRLTGAYGADTPLLMALYTPEMAWDAVDPAAYDAWLAGYLPPGMEGFRGTALEAVTFRRAARDRLTGAR